MTRLLGVCVFVVLAAACRSGGATEQPTPAPTETQIPATATPTATPTPSPTPDPLGPPPRSVAEAMAGFERYLAASSGPRGCPERLKSAWGVVCAEGDLDGDGVDDAAYLVPLNPAATTLAHPAAVLVRRASGTGYETFPIEGEADASPIGTALFGVAERTGDKAAEVTYVRNSCTVASCSSVVHIQRWDGTSWRDAGPGDQGIPGVVEASFEGKGAASKLVMTGGKLNSVLAGPTRSVTVTYEFSDGRYRQAERDSEEPQYLYHAILDADRLFDAGKFPEAVTAYRLAIADESLKDWKKEAGRPGDGRAELHGYALFRIAVAIAAQPGGNPAAALDDVITGSKEPLWAYAAQDFRKGFLEGDGVMAGCALATQYLATTEGASDNPAYVRRIFDYGYANAARTFREICRLP